MHIMDIILYFNFNQFDEEVIVNLVIFFSNNFIKNYQWNK